MNDKLRFVAVRRLFIIVRRFFIKSFFVGLKLRRLERGLAAHVNAAQRVRRRLFFAPARVCAAGQRFERVAQLLDRLGSLFRLPFAAMFAHFRRKYSGADARDDVAEGLALEKFYLGRADEFEDGEEGEDEFAPRLGALEEVAQVQLARREDHVAKAFEHLRHRDLLALDLHQDLFLATREYLLEDSQKIERARRPFRVLLVRLQCRARVDGLLHGRARVEHLGGGLELLVFEETLYKFAARVEFIQLLLAHRGVARQEHARFYLDERGGHDEKVACDRDVRALHHAQVLKVLVRDARDGDVVDADLLLPYEIEQEVERARELAEDEFQLLAASVSDDFRRRARDVDGLPLRRARDSPLFCGLRRLLRFARQN